MMVLHKIIPPSATKWSACGRYLSYKVVDSWFLVRTPSRLMKDTFYRLWKLIIFIHIFQFCGLFYFLSIHPAEKRIFMLSWQRAPEMLTLRRRLPNGEGGRGVSTVIASVGNQGADRTVSLHSGPERCLWSRSALAFHVASGRQFFFTLHSHPGGVSGSFNTQNR